MGETHLDPPQVALNLAAIALSLAIRGEPLLCLTLAGSGIVLHPCEVVGLLPGMLAGTSRTKHAVGLANKGSEKRVGFTAHVLEDIHAAQHSSLQILLLPH